jgi:hypothetical protein
MVASRNRYLPALPTTFINSEGKTSKKKRFCLRRDKKQSMGRIAICTATSLLMLMKTLE